MNPCNRMHQNYLNIFFSEEVIKQWNKYKEALSSSELSKLKIVVLNLNCLF